MVKKRQCEFCGGVSENHLKIDGILKIEGRPYLPSDDPKLTASASSGFFNANLLKKYVGNE